MQWRGRRMSSNTGRGGGPAKIGGLGLIIFALIYSFFGGNVSDVINMAGAGQTQQVEQQASDPARRNMEDMLSVVLADTEDVWHQKFAEVGERYEEPKLMFFEERVRSGCGVAGKSTGPFYCPVDKTIYMDVTFANDLQRKFGGQGGDFAMAYVLAHEIGHHVQNQSGLLMHVHKLQQQMSEADAKKYSVALELHADYLAGVFAYYVQQKGYLDAGDIEEAINAAKTVGDDHLQKITQGQIRPEEFTHGTSAQRAEWFRRGMQYHDFGHGDTFGALGLQI